MTQADMYMMIINLKERVRMLEEAACYQQPLGDVGGDIILQTTRVRDIETGRISFLSDLMAVDPVVYAEESVDPAEWETASRLVIKGVKLDANSKRGAWMKTAADNWGSFSRWGIVWDESGDVITVPKWIY